VESFECSALRVVLLSCVGDREKAFCSFFQVRMGANAQVSGILFILLVGLWLVDN